ncbi:MAG: DUF349 domain-containing protein [Paramuribaculum sp.]|nr:DUF349 domain-containing protein [Paramuribaculum sp.]
MELLNQSAEQINNTVADRPLTDETTNVEVSETVIDTIAPVSKSELIDQLKSIADLSDVTQIDNDAVSRIKQQFYQLHNNELQTLRSEAEAKGEELKIETVVDPLEDELKTLLGTIKARKAEYRAQLEAQCMRNYERKRAIVDELMTMSADTDNVNRHYNRVKELQAEFKEMGEVLPQQQSEIWKSFQDAVEHFYDQWKVNKELRDYDFKKNLAEKQLLITEAEALDAEPDVITAFKRLQALHDKWRDVGPVAKELREELWAKFKDASAVISKKYQAHFEERKAREKENETAKTAICERLEALDFSAPATYAAWDDMTKIILEAQGEWKTLGFASRKLNNALFARFRALCDDFFARKSAFYKGMKDSLADNLAKKTALCEKAEALKESSDWKKATEQLVALQAEWKTIGAVQKKQSDAIWKRFISACDYFFDRKKEALSGTRKAEQANLKAKKEVLAELTALNAADCTAERADAIKQIHALRAKWQETGHVPFREKDKIHEAYRTVVGELFDKYDIHETKARMASFENSISDIAGDSNKLMRERDRLMRAYESRKSELATYENNLGFFNSKSASGEAMLKELQRKIQRIKDDIRELERKVSLIDAKL